MQKFVDKVIAILWNKKFWAFLGIFILTLIYIISFKASLEKAGTFTAKKMALFVVATVVLLVVLGMIYYFGIKKQLAIEKLFLLVVIPLGVIYLLITPSFSGSDDRAHFFRAHEISEGVLITPSENGEIGGKHDSSLIQLGDMEISDHKYHLAADFLTLDYSGEKVQTGYASSALYSPLSYLPQVIGLKTGEILKFSPYALTMAGRIFNFLFYVIICFFAFKLLPRFKMFFLILMTAPILLASATTFSADGFLCALVFLFVSATMYFIHEKATINKKWILLFWVLSGLIASCKVIYFPIIFGVFFIKKTAFKSKKQRIIFILGCLLFALIIGFGWMKIAGGALNNIYPDSVAQELGILQNPIRYLAVLLSSTFNNGAFYIENIFAAAPIYNGSVTFSWFISRGFVVIALLALLVETKKNILSKRQRTLVAILALVIVVLICTALYVQWTVIKCGLNCNTIVGVQGRYFIPALMIATLAFGAAKLKISHHSLLAWALVFQLFSALTIMQTFAT